MANLSKTMIDVLDQAEYCANHSIEEYRINPNNIGWVTPQHHESAKIFARHQTCKALARRGVS